jgi:hypothetical protein
MRMMDVYLIQTIGVKMKKCNCGEMPGLEANSVYDPHEYMIVCLGCGEESMAASCIDSAIENWNDHCNYLALANLDYPG